MSRRAVRNGNPTTTSGMIIAVLSTMFNHCKRVHLDGGKATCGNCEATFLPDSEKRKAQDPPRTSWPMISTAHS